jgi:hypothetical protein
VAPPDIERITVRIPARPLTEQPYTAPSGWVRVLRADGDPDGVPLWRWRHGPCYVATRDMDQLRFLGAALTRFEQMTGPELRAFVAP